MSSPWIGLLAVIAILAGLFVFLDRMLASRERHWELPDDERPRSPHAGVGNALMELHDVLQPGAKAAIEEHQRADREHDGEGDPPEK